jgi:integrase/recombinase XerD
MAKSYLEANEVESLERAATNLRDRLLIRLLFHLGCRVSEALGATVEDIDLTKSTVTIQHLKTRMKLSCPRCSVRLSKSHTYCPGCGVKVEQVVAEEKEHRRQRVLPVDSETLSALKDYIRRGGPVLRDGKRLVFGINRHRAWQIVKECASKAGLPKLVNRETGRVHNVSPHCLRTAFAVHAMKLNDSGDGLLSISEMGHFLNRTLLHNQVALTSSLRPLL